MDRWKSLTEETAALVMVTVIEGVFAFLVGEEGGCIFQQREFCRKQVLSVLYQSLCSSGHFLRRVAWDKGGMSEHGSQMKDDDSGSVGQTGCRIPLGSTYIHFTQQHAGTNVNWTWNVIYHTSLHRFLYPIEGFSGSVSADWQIKELHSKHPEMAQDTDSCWPYA